MMRNPVAARRRGSGASGTNMGKTGMVQQRDDSSRARWEGRRTEFLGVRPSGWLFALGAFCGLGLCSCTQTAVPSADAGALLERPHPERSNAQAATPAAVGDGPTNGSTGDDAAEGIVRIAGSSDSNTTLATPAAHGSARSDDCPTVFTPCEPRCPTPTGAHLSCPLPNCPTSQGPTPQWPLAPGAVPAPYAVRDGSDEYLCDGGDRDLPVHYNGRLRMGLETEDTVAEYTDDEGQTHVRESTRVCIYAPRFGAVRAMTAPREDYSIDRLGSASKLTYSTGLRNRVALRDHTQRTQLDGVRVRSRVSGLETEVKHSGVNHAASLAQHELLQNVFQNLAFIRRGELDQRDRAFLALGIHSAVTWTRDLYPKIIAVDAGASEVVSTFKAEEFTAVEDEKKIGRLRILKFADRKTAKPGDTVTFTLRYDNLGDRELREIRIVDNLTPRLAFLADSVSSDREGDLKLEDNGEGSHVLTFSLKEPLPGHTGGVITFQTRVR